MKGKRGKVKEKRGKVKGKREKARIEERKKGGDKENIKRQKK